jgi:hypothetical protein
VPQGAAEFQSRGRQLRKSLCISERASLLIGTDNRASLNKLFSHDWAANLFPNGKSPENEQTITLEPTDSGELEFGRNLTTWLQQPKRRA